MNTIRSMNFAAHGAIGEQLTNRQIDAYALLGRYGRKKQKEYFTMVSNGTLRTFDARIRKGEFGHKARMALQARKTRKVKRKKSEAELTADVLAALGLEDLLPEQC